MLVYCNLYMKAHTHTLQNKKTASGGKYEFLFSMLRDHADEPGIKRVDEVLSLLVSAERHRREIIESIDRGGLTGSKGGIPEFLDVMKRREESKDAYYQALELLNIKLSRYRWEATLSGDLEGFSSSFIPSHPKNKWEFSGRKSWDATELWKYSEYTDSFLAQRDEWLTQVEDLQPQDYKHSWDSMGAFMVELLLRAVDKGEISRFRRCSECQQWFYAIRGHQHFCGDVCRRKHEAQSPAFKEKRAAYMRDRYRPDQKRKEERAKRQAARVLTEKSRKGGR